MNSPIGLKFKLDNQQHTLFVGDETPVVEILQRDFSGRYTLINLDEINSLSEAGHIVLKWLAELSNKKIDQIREEINWRLSDRSSGIEILINSLEMTELLARKKGIDLFVVFNDFPKLLEFDEVRADEQLRGYIQHHEKITYIFIGKDKEKMNAIFQSHRSPFLHFAI